MELTLALFLVLSPLVFHEMGHWVALKRLGVPTTEFWLGLGPQVIRLGRVRVGMLPIGGAVVPEPDSFSRLTPNQRMWVCLAGPVASVLYGAVLLSLWAAFAEVQGVRGLLGIAGLNFFLAAVNILPVPPLDGFGAWAAWREREGRPLQPRTLQIAYRLGNGMVYGIGFFILGLALLMP